MPSPGTGSLQHTLGQQTKGASITQLQAAGCAVNSEPCQHCPPRAADIWAEPSFGQLEVGCPRPHHRHCSGTSPSFPAVMLSCMQIVTPTTCSMQTQARCSCKLLLTEQL